MPRLPRLYIKDVLYYVTCRAVLNEQIFRASEDYAMFLELIQKYKQQYGVRLYAYALMPDHVHMLIETEEVSDFMHNLNNTYTKSFNSRYERKGHLFRERFKAALIERQPNLLKMTAYIHLNPQRVNVAVNAADYRYSSYPAYLNPQAVSTGPQMNSEIDEVLKMLNDNNYAGLVAGMTEDEGRLVHKRIHRGGVLGSEQFAKMVKSQIQAYERQGRQQGQKVEADTRRYKILAITTGFIVLLIVGAAGAALYYVKRNANTLIGESKAAAAFTRPQDINGTEWQVKLVPVSGGAELVDNLIFKSGKFTSARLYAQGYPDSNFSSSIQDGRLTWETMQSAGASSISWRGEIASEQMTGVVSLREDGQEPQDFSFSSVTYRRRE